MIVIAYCYYVEVWIFVNSHSWYIASLSAEL